MLQSSDEECTFPISCSLLFEVETDTTGAQFGDAEISVSAARLRVSMTKRLNKGVPNLDKVICAILLAHETLFQGFPEHITLNLLLVSSVIFMTSYSV